MNKKNYFIIVGAQRSGTTYIYNILDEHPQICMARPVFPEPKYFINKSIKEINLTKYHTNFYSHYVSDNHVLGEKSTSYYEKEESAQLISTLIPDCKIIFVLRNPIDRAISNYYFSVKNGLEIRSLEEVFINNIPPPKINNCISVNPFDYLVRGEYVRHIETYLKYFSKEQLKILVFENFIGNINKIQNLYKFLSVDSNFYNSKTKLLIRPPQTRNNMPSNVINHLVGYYRETILSLEKLVDNNDIDVLKQYFD